MSVLSTVLLVLTLVLAGALGGALVRLARRATPTPAVPTDPVLLDQLAQLRAHVQRLDVERARADGELGEQLRDVARVSGRLGDQTARLVDALRRPQARGRWGEMQLQRVVELAGMQDRVDHSSQHSVRDADGGLLRPDLVVHLTGGRTVVVDAKVTLAAYLEATEASDEQVAVERMRAHARHLRVHVDRLADKQYWKALPQTPEFVVLFVPGEAFLAPALEHDPTLLEHALSRQVHLATPTTLVSLLRTAAHAWRQQSLADDARQVLASGQELAERLGVMTHHLDTLGKAMGRSVEAFNQTVGSLEHKVLPSARRMAGLALPGDPADPGSRPLAAPPAVDVQPRPLRAAG